MPAILPSAASEPAAPAAPAEAAEAAEPAAAESSLIADADASAATADAAEPTRSGPAAKLPPQDRPRRPIKSFVVRAGRMGSGQQRAMVELAPLYVLPFRAERLDPAAVFGRSAPLVLEIGFGMGDATAQIAQTLADHDFIGCEVHEPGVGALLQLIEARQISNIRILQHDAVEVLEQMIAPASLAGVHVFFPDPWHKLRHNKRRLIQPAFVAELLRFIRPGGYLHCATDWEPYAQQMLSVLTAEPLLENTAAGYAETPAYRPLTKFENRGIKLGHGVWDLVFKRRLSDA